VEDHASDRLHGKPQRDTVRMVSAHARSVAEVLRRYATPWQIAAAGDFHNCNVVRDDSQCRGVAITQRRSTATALKALEQGLARAYLSPDQLHRSAEEKITQARTTLEVLVNGGVISREPVQPS
jgi:hypothetical protein